MAAMLVYLDKRILNIFFWKYTNMAANFFVVLIPRDWVKTLYMCFHMGLGMWDYTNIILSVIILFIVLILNPCDITTFSYIYFHVTK